MANIKKHRLLNKDEVDENAVKTIPSVLSFDASLSDDDEETTYHDIVPDMECGYREKSKGFLCVFSFVLCSYISWLFSLKS